MSHAGVPYQDSGMCVAGEAGLPGSAVQWHIMGAWRDGWQGRGDDGRCRCTASGPSGVAGAAHEVPNHALMAVFADLDCRPIHDGLVVPLPRERPSAPPAPASPPRWSALEPGAAWHCGVILKINLLTFMTTSQLTVSFPIT